MDYAAAWMVEGGVPQLRYEVGRIVGALGTPLTGPALVQQALRSRHPVYADAGPPAEPICGWPPPGPGRRQGRDGGPGAQPRRDDAR